MRGLIHGAEGSERENDVDILHNSEFGCLQAQLEISYSQLKKSAGSPSFCQRGLMLALAGCLC